MPYAIPTVTAAAVVATAGTLTYAALSAQSQLFGPTLIAPTKPNEIALTYDDGPNPAATPQLLEVLARHNVHATFFLIGNFVRQCPALVREIAAAGHLIGNHTTTHPWLPFHSAARITEGISHNQNRNRASNIVLHDGGSLGLGAPRIPTVEATNQVLQHYKSTPTNFVTLEAWV
jgi:peptidoglycan/xylan/chitin deacetylase (PgdA/CDA1 family)